MQNNEVKIGLIENEFGEVSIDAKLIANYKPECIIELNNGCICCSIFNEFSMALQELIKANEHLEQLIIETTGLADPGPIIEPFFQDADLMRLFELNGTICLVDSVNFDENIKGLEQQKQVLLSDMIIINKSDEVDAHKLESIMKKVNALNKTAIIIETNFAHLDSSHLYMLQPQLQDEFIKKIKKPFYSEPDSSEFHSFTIRFSGLLNEGRFREWFNYFASVHRKEIYRIKGIVNFQNNPITGFIQSVGGISNISEGSIINPYEPIENILVFIGKGISKFEIEKTFQQYLTQEN